MQKARIKSAQILSPKLVKESDESQQIRKGNNNNVDDRFYSDK